MKPMEERVTKNQLKWFGHGQRRPLESSMRRVDHMFFIPVKMVRGRPRRTLEEVIKRDVMVSNIPENLVFNELFI